MSMSPPGYDAEADFAATGSVLCDDCGTRVHPATLATLPSHGCSTAQQANRALLAQVVQHRVFRNIAGGDAVWEIGNGQPFAAVVDYAALQRLTAAGMIRLPEPGEREPYYEITDRALQGA